MVMPSLWVRVWGFWQAGGSDPAGLAGGSAALRSCGCPWRTRSLGVRFRVTNTDGGIQTHQGGTFSTVPHCSHPPQRAGDRRRLRQEASRANSRRKPRLPWTRIWCWLTPVPRRRSLISIQGRSARCIWCKGELDLLTRSERSGNKELEALRYLKPSEMLECKLNVCWIGYHAMLTASLGWLAKIIFTNSEIVAWISWKRLFAD